MDRVSLLIPVYNAGPSLSKCLESLLAQTYPEIEIIVIDDGSQDDTADLVRLYQNQDPRIHLFSFPNSGVSISRNRALDLSTGDYVMFVDGDDTLDKEAISNMMKMMKEGSCQIVCCGFYQEYGCFKLRRAVHKKAILTREEALVSLVEDTGINNYPWGKLFERSMFDNVRFPVEDRAFEDTLTIYQTLCNATRIGVLPDRYYHYIMNPGSLTSRMDLTKALGMKRAYEKQEKDLCHRFPQYLFSYDKTYFNCEMVILYALLMYSNRKEIIRYVPSRIDWAKIPLLFRFAYHAMLGIVRLKFGDHLILEGEL